MEFKDVPKGKYEVKITKLELKASKKSDDPMLACWMKIIAGECKGQNIFYYQMLTTGFGIHTANGFLKSLDSGVDIEFDNFKQYNDMLLDITEAIESEKLEYVLDYGENEKGFKTFKIEEVFYKRMIFFDFEIFYSDWLVVLADANTQTFRTIINDPDKLRRYYEKNKNEVWIGYNSRGYDQYILKGLLLDFGPV